MQGVNFLRPPLDRSVTASENVVIWSIETDIVDWLSDICAGLDDWYPALLNQVKVSKELHDIFDY